MSSNHSSLQLLLEASESAKTAAEKVQSAIKELQKQTTNPSSQGGRRKSYKKRSNRKRKYRKSHHKK